MLEPEVEQWRDIPGWEGVYAASTFGRIKSLQRVIQWNGTHRNVPERILKPTLDSYGYQMVSLHRNNRQTTSWVHRVVLTTFVGPGPLRTECCHNDGRKLNNTLSNLRWDTRAGNLQDRVKHGTVPVQSGERNPRAKLTLQNVAEIRALFTAGAELIGLAQKFSVTTTNIRYITQNKTWRA